MRAIDPAWRANASVLRCVLPQAVVNEHARGDVEALQMENQRLARLVAQLRCGDDTLSAEIAALRERLEQVALLPMLHGFQNVLMSLRL